MEEQKSSSAPEFEARVSFNFSCSIEFSGMTEAQVRELVMVRLDELLGTFPSKLDHDLPITVNGHGANFGLSNYQPFSY